MLNKKLEDFIKVNDIENKFISYFDPDTGFYMRTGILDEAGKDTGVDPFMTFFPQLLDVGIMGHCHHGLSGLCKSTGIKCYQSGGEINHPNMLLEDFKSIVDQSKGKVFQFALGGRGDPELHEDIEEILAYSRSNGIIPNMTTSGFMLTKEKAELIKKYCGAAAVSWYRNDYTMRAIEMLLSLGVKTNIHFVLDETSIDEAIDLLKNRKVPKGVNRIIFLLFKPVGQGKEIKALSMEDPRTKEFFQLFDEDYALKYGGFDSCSVPAMINFTKKLDPNCFDTCEGGRYSAYITPDMKILPCSFDQENRWAVDLKKYTIAEAWKSIQFEEFRNHQRNACPDCKKRSLCLGGCPVKPEIVLCNEKHNV